MFTKFIKMSTLKGFDSKSLKAGDALPPLAPGQQRVYAMRFCPFAQRSLLLLAHKGIDAEVVNINLDKGNKPTWFREKTPIGQVPVLEKDDQIVYGVCPEYLEDEYSNSRLLPTDAYGIARQKMMLEKMAKFTGGFFPFIFALDEIKRNSFLEGLDICEGILTGAYYGGDSVGYVDLMVWPFLERTLGLSMDPAFQVTLPDLQRFPKLSTYIDRMMNEKAVKMVGRSPALHLQFLNGFRAAKADYDLGI